MTQMVIGVTPLYDVQRDSVWMIPGYLDGITEAGGIPGIFPAGPRPKELDQLVRDGAVGGLCLPADRM